ncbi:chorismate mutase, partial [bacterium]|nr:chorismate mutase [bacterium]
MRILVLVLLLSQALWAQPAKLLLQGMARRLEISREVAWIKWKSHLPIEDGPREEALLAALPTLAGLDPDRSPPLRGSPDRGQQRTADLADGKLG